MRILTRKLNSYSLEQLIENVPKIKGTVFSLMQSSDKKGNPTKYWDAVYFSDLDGIIKYRIQADSPKMAVVGLYKLIRSKRK